MQNKVEYTDKIVYVAIDTSLYIFLIFLAINILKVTKLNIEIFCYLDSMIF